MKRKFRVPGQTFADSIGALISFIEGNPMVRASELAPKFLGLAIAPTPTPAPKLAETTPPIPAPAEGEAAASAATPALEAPKAEPTLTIDERAKLARMQGDLMWLVREGYVTEFIDGRLFAPPPMVEARKKEIEGEEHDPENFPEVPATVAESAPATEPAPAPAMESAELPPPAAEEKPAAPPAM